jgi:hypothetical protein|tara:strand:+ start:151732 stop:152301 length:570 start_codon:yes stop_codon:yes gene_type:complete
MTTLCKTLLNFMAIACVGSALAAPAHAEKKAQEAQTPVTQYAAETEDLIKSLSDEQVEKYYKIRHVHGVIRSVKSVESIIDKAVKSCKKNHKDLGKSIEERFAEWRVAVRPVIKKGNERLEKLVLLQDYAKPSQVKKHLKNFDTAAEYGESLIDMKPAADEKSCSLLLENMDKTQPDLIRLLQKSIGLE